MAPGAQVDWFSQNAPPPASSSGDWFSKNAPSGSRQPNTAGPDYGNVKPAVPGNIQWYGRPSVKDPSLPHPGTVYSASREQDGKEVLYPQIYDGKLHSDDEAWQHYRDTGQHMGKFNSVADADAFAQKYHEDAAAGKYDAAPPAGSQITSSATIAPAPSTSQRAQSENAADASTLVNSSFPYIHPLDAMGAVQDRIGKLTAPIENYTQEGRAEHPVLSRIGDLTSGAKDLIGKVGPEVSALTGGAAAAEATPQLLEGAGNALNAARAGAARKLIQPLVYEGPGEAMADTRFGQDPARGIQQAGIYGTKEGMARDAGERIGQLKDASNKILQNHPNANVKIDAAPHIDAAINDAIQNTRETAGSTERLERLREELKSSYGKTSGTPLEMNDLKGKIQDAADRLGAYKNTAPEEGTIARALGDTARRIKEQVNQTVPEVAPLNAQMADLSDARSGLNRKVQIAKGEDLLGGDLFDIPSRAARRTIGSAPVRSGIARALSLGLKEPIPETPFSYQAPDIDTSSAESVPYNRLARVQGRDYSPRRADKVAAIQALEQPTPPSVRGTGRNTSPPPIQLGESSPGTFAIQKLPADLGRQAPGVRNTAIPSIKVGESVTPGGKLARVEGRRYSELAPIQAGTATPAPRVLAGERGPTLPVEQAAASRGKLQRILDDPNATAVEKSNARSKLRTLGRQ